MRAWWRRQARWVRVGLVVVAVAIAVQLLAFAFWTVFFLLDRGPDVLR